MEKRIKDYNSFGLKQSQTSSRAESVKKLRNELLEQLRVLAEQQRIQLEEFEKILREQREENQRMIQEMCA